MMSDQKRAVRRNLCIFLALCLPLTWILMGISYGIAPQGEENPAAVLLLAIACYVPAAAAVLTSVRTGEGAGKLCILPRLQGNGRMYFAAILGGLVISCGGDLLVMSVFPSVQGLSSDTSVPMLVFTVLLHTAVGCILFFILLGEEIGWMGFLYPHLEKLHGTAAAILFTGLTRTLWHLVLLAETEEFLKNFLLLCISNILGSCFLVLLTKKSGSVVPAAVVHSLTNSVSIGAFLEVEETLYEANELGIYLVSIVPEAVIAIVCFVILIHQKTDMEDQFYYQKLTEEIRERITGSSYPDTQEPLGISYEELAYVHILHYNFEMEISEGEIICNRAIAQDLVEIFEELFAQKYLIGKVRLVDEYHADDEASMADNNSSCFNYRVIAGTDKISNHSYGLAIDINPLYNPYITYREDGTQNVAPANAKAYADRETDFPHRIDHDDLCYRLFTEHGFTWGGDWTHSRDYQHFEKTAGKKKRVDKIKKEMYSKQKD